MRLRLGMVVVAAALVVGALLSVSAAPDGAIPAPEALAKAKAGKIAIVDVRQPSEWRETGLPQDAIPISLHDAQQAVRHDFVRDIENALGGDKDAPVALICAGGVRSSAARELLVDAGFTHVFDINEGMFGNGEDPGWLARELPVTPCSHC
jgi:rhodanese-related sulfurtransferase